MRLCISAIQYGATRAPIISLKILPKQLYNHLIQIVTMVSIETNAKNLATLLKKKEKLEANSRKLNEEITKQQSKLNTQFDKIGLDTNFS